MWKSHIFVHLLISQARNPALLTTEPYKDYFISVCNSCRSQNSDFDEIRPRDFILFCLQTTLAHIIASSCKKKGTARFVTLSATSTSTNEVREVIKQAQNELRLCKRKTILFIDEIHRFNKSQQVSYRGVVFLFFSSQKH